MSQHSPLIASMATCVLVGTAVFFLAAPPIILLPATLIVGTIHFELRARALRRAGRR